MVEVMTSEVDCRRGAHVNPDIFKLENKPKNVLCHEIGAGSRCLKCDCPGLDLHYWRKMCKVCSCRMDDHDVILPRNMDHGQIVIGSDFVTSFVDFTCSLCVPISQTSRLFDFIPEFESKLRLHPPSPSLPNFKKAYLSSNIKLEFRSPLFSDPNLSLQLPHHDSDSSAAKSLKTELDRKEHAKYVNTVKEKIVGVGRLIEFSEANTLNETTSPGSHDVGSIGFQGNYGKCQFCHKNLQIGEVAVVTDHGSPDEIWHVNCFKCHICNQRLVDLLYFYKNGIYYCGRHFGDSLIFSKEYTFAEDKSWHLDHFCCFGCDMQLGGHRYMMKDEQPYCFNCYMERYAKVCRYCRKVLLNQRFIVKNEEVFCSSECKRSFVA
uniref:LIM zinc-binding domain-containing protein n=1 Tax=Elaeophora elaphi TaxID=1147741 RepID=A0A0R3S5D1_9BILA